MIIAVFGSVMLTTIEQNNSDYIQEQVPASVVIMSQIQQSVYRDSPKWNWRNSNHLSHICKATQLIY